jgi:hypothetical protein
MQIYNKCISKALEEAFYLLEQFIIDLKNMEALVSNVLVNQGDHLDFKLLQKHFFRAPCRKFMVSLAT